MTETMNPRLQDLHTLTKQMRGFPPARIADAVWDWMAAQGLPSDTSEVEELREVLAGADHTAAKYWRRMREAETARARAMARIEQLSDHLGIPYEYETGNGPVRPRIAPPVYLAADLWDALGAPVSDFDAYYERNRWADTWANLLGTVRDRFRPKCGELTEGERCVLTAGHLPPHYGTSDVGRSEPVPVAEPQGEPSDAQVEAAHQAWSDYWDRDEGGENRPSIRAALIAAATVTEQGENHG